MRKIETQKSPSPLTGFRSNPVLVIEMSMGQGLPVGSGATCRVRGHPWVRCPLAADFSLFPEQGMPRLGRQVGLSVARVRVRVSVSTSDPEACEPPLPCGGSRSLVLAEEAGLPGFSDWNVADGSQKIEEASPPSRPRCQGSSPSCSRHLKRFFCLRAKCFMLSLGLHNPLSPSP